MVVKRIRVKRLLTVLIFLLFTSTSLFVEPVAPDPPNGNNTLPLVTDENPVNNSVNVCVLHPVNVTVDDDENDFLNATWYSNSSGPWLVFAQDFNINTSNGTVNIQQVNNNFTNYSTMYYWSVNVTDGTSWTNNTYCFTTMESGMGWRLIANNTVLDMWNRVNHYYFNVSNGVQFTNHYNEYWAHNVMMLGYLTPGGIITDPDDWNLIYRVDELSGFNRQLRTDNQTYINVTLWKDLSYGSYDFRLAIRYHLGVDDMDLSVTPYVKNLGIPIPFVTAFGWELKDIRIGGTEHNSSIYINQTRYLLNQTPLDNRYTNLTRVVMLWNETSQQNENITIPDSMYTLYRAGSQYQDLYLKWNNTLKYLVWVRNRTMQYNAPVILFLKIGKLGVGQERYTTMHWLDSTLNLRPDVDGSLNQWSQFGDATMSHWDNVDDLVGTPDEDSTYVYTGTNNKFEDFNHATSALLTGATISNVRVTVRARKIRAQNAVTFNIGVRIGLTTYAGTTPGSITTSYVDYSWDWALNPADSQAWEKSDIDNLQSSTQSSIVGGFAPELRVTQVYLTITYTFAAPMITIDFVGNLGGSGGPFWRPPLESVKLTGAYSDGYITNDSRHSENWMYILCNLTSAVGIDTNRIYVNWLNGTTWTNNTYALVSAGGDSYEFNTSGNISVACGYNYSFNIVAADTDVKTNTSYWNKTGIGGGMTRRWVQLGCTPVNISYTPYYYHNTTYTNSDKYKHDRLQHDQGGDGQTYDTSIILSAIPTDIETHTWCTSAEYHWFDEPVCSESFLWRNLYYHIWWKTDNDNATYRFIKSRKYAGAEGPADNSHNTSLNTTNSRSVVKSDAVGTVVYLNTDFWDIADVSSTDNDIYEILLSLREDANNPTTTCNRSIISFIIPNVPSNILDGTDNSTDTDGDGLSDHMELNTTYGVHTNPFIFDTDNDGVDDCNECKSGSDPNNYTSTTANTPPAITGEIPANQSVGISTTPLLNVTVDDANDNALDAYWYSNSSGPWVLFDTNLSIVTSSGAVIISQTNTNFTANSQTYWWSVNATDGCLWANETYHFTTTAVAVNNPPVQTSPCVWNVTTGENKSLNATNVDLFPTSFNVTVNDADGDYMNISMLTNESGSWTTVNTTSSGMLNGTFQGYNTTWVDSYSTKYWICFNVSDDEDWDNETYNFTTACSLVFEINRTSFGFGIVQNDTMTYSNATEPDTFKIYNNGSCSIDIDINGTNATSSGVTDWNLSSSNGDNQYKMEIYNTSTNWVQINKTASTWYNNMAQSTNITADTRITTPTIFYSGKQMSCTVYMTASVH